MTQPSDAGRDQGFTLIEVLVGFVIVTLGLVSFFTGLGLSYRQMAESRMRQDALAHAQSHLESLGQTQAVEPGTATGTYLNGGRWRLAVTELATAGHIAQARLVVLDTYDPSGRFLLRLRTVKLAAVRP